MSKLIIITLLLCTTLFADQVKVFITGEDCGSEPDVRKSIVKIVKTRFKSNPLLAGHTALTVVTGLDSTIERVCIQRDQIRDDTVLTAFAAELLQHRYCAGTALRFDITIPWCINSDQAVRCSEPDPSNDQDATLVIVRRIEDEDDHDFGYIYLNAEYIGSTLPDRVNVFMVPPGKYYLLCRKDHEHDEFDVLLVTLESGQRYYLWQEFIDTPAFHNLSIKAIEPSFAKTLIYKAQLKFFKAETDQTADLDEGTFQNALHEYFEDIEEENNDFFDDYIDDKEIPESVVDIFDEPCRPDGLPVNAPAINYDSLETSHAAQRFLSEKSNAIRSIKTVTDSAEHFQGLAITVNSANPTILINDSLLCRCQNVKLNMPVGDYTITVKDPGYYDQRVSAEVEKMSVDEVSISLRKYRVYFSAQLGSTLKMRNPVKYEFGFTGQGGIEYRYHFFNAHLSLSMSLDEEKTLHDTTQTLSTHTIGGGIGYSYTRLHTDGFTFAPWIAGGYWGRYQKIERELAGLDTIIDPKKSIIDRYFCMAGVRFICGSNRARFVFGGDSAIKKSPVYVRFFAGAYIQIL